MKECTDTGTKNPSKRTVKDETDIAKVKKTRKSHKNSKLGCSNCKKNQIKCDETLPICNNCQRKDLPCSYLFMPTGEFHQLVQLIDLKETSEVLIESTDRLYDTTLCQPYFNDKIETQAGFNVKPPVRRQAALRVKKSENPEDQSTKEELVFSEDPLLKFFNKNTENDAYSEVETTYLGEAKYGNSIPDSFVFKQYDQSAPASPKSTEKFVCLPDQPNVKFVPLQEKMAELDSLQLDSFLTNFVVDASDDGSSISKIREHYAHLSSVAPTIYELESDKSGYSSNTPNSFSLSPDLVDGINHQHEDYISKRFTFEKEIEGFDSKNKTRMIMDRDSLDGAKIVNKTLKLNSGYEFRWFDSFLSKLISTFQHVQQNNVKLLFAKYGVFNIDAFYEKVYRVQVILTSMFSKITRMASLLFVFDTIKNTLCKQKSILPLLREDMRIAICRNFEELSTKTLSNLTNLINCEYLPRYNMNYGPQKEVLFTGFVVLSGCTVLHYNSGYRQSMSIEQSKKCVDFIGTFTAGVFSMIINRDENASKDKHNYLTSYSRYVMLYSKLIIVPNYNSELFTEIFELFKSLGLNKIPNLKRKSWSSCYIDLYIFLEKHSYFLKVYRDHSNLLGFERGYLVRLINEWYQIFPHDLMNIAYLKCVDEDAEILALIHLTFLALRYYLEALIPGIRSFVRNSFLGGENFGYDSTAALMKVFSLLTKKQNKVYAMYMIRFTTFFCLRFHGVKSILAKVHIPELSDSKEMTNAERCDNLFTQRKYGNLITEVQKLTMLTKSGFVIQEQNYPSLTQEGKSPKNVEPTKNFKFKSTNEFLADFSKTNSGLFSDDYDPRDESLNLKSVASALDEIKIKANENSNVRNTLASIPHSDVNTSTMKNCWALEMQMKMNIK